MKGGGTPGGHPCPWRETGDDFPASVGSHNSSLGFPASMGSHNSQLDFPASMGSHNSQWIFQPLWVLTIPRWIFQPPWALTTPSWIFPTSMGVSQLLVGFSNLCGALTAPRWIFQPLWRSHNSQLGFPASVGSLSCGCCQNNPTTGKKRSRSLGKSLGSALSFSPLECST